MKIEIENGSYNSRRFGKPWIAVVSFDGDGKADFDFGRYIGDDRGGLRSIDVEPGQIVATGQKDFRDPRNSSPEFFVVQADGTLGERLEKLEAYKLWRESNKSWTLNPLAGFSDVEIIAEARRRGLM